MPKLLRYEFVLEAEQPIAHHSESFGNEAIAMRRRVRMPDGDFADVPIITGDTMRHGIRDAGARAYLDAAGLLGDGTLSEAALRLIFSGGMITGRGDGGAVSFDAYREICELLPLIAFLGGCAGNRCIPGSLTVEDATLICDESARWVPEWAREAAGPLATCRAHVEAVQRVRMDPMLDPGNRRMLVAGDAAAAEKRLAARAKAGDDGDAVAELEHKSTMMPRSFERIVQGSLFFWRVSCLCRDDLTTDAFLTSLAAFLYEPTVGGKKGTGHGRLRGVAARNIELLRPADTARTVEVQSLGHTAGTLFRAHVAERKDRIREFLRTVDA